jgi:HAD superfamily hydrolase (TIGR01549 family)
MGTKGVIFDMDGTITAPYFDFGKIKAEANIGDADMLDYLRAATGAEYERIHGLLMKFEEDGAANAELNKGARALLDALAKRGMPTALLTRNSRKSVDSVCRKFDLVFDIVITREDGPHKPAPEPIWEIARRWGAKPGELLMVGDYKWDLLCAKNAGAPCAILVDGGVVPEWAKDAAYVIDRLDGVLNILDKELA